MTSDMVSNHPFSLISSRSSLVKIVQEWSGSYHTGASQERVVSLVVGRIIFGGTVSGLTGEEDGNRLVCCPMLRRQM